MNECLTSYVPTLKNYADMLTKALYGKKRRTLVGDVLHYIYDDYGQIGCPNIILASLNQ